MSSSTKIVPIVGAIVLIAGIIAIVSTLPMFGFRMVPDWFVAGAFPGTFVVLMINRVPFGFRVVVAAIGFFTFSFSC